MSASENPDLENISVMAANVGHLRGLGISCSVRLVKILLKERNFKWNYQTSQQTKSVAKICWRMRKMSGRKPLYNSDHMQSI
jgi:hypothetical protein